MRRRDDSQAPPPGLYLAQNVGGMAMNAPTLDPISALAGAAASVKDALRAARHAMREGRRRLAPPLASGAPFADAANMAARGVDAAMAGCFDAAARAARAARDHAPLAPPRTDMPASLEAIRALLARGARGRIALAESGHAALRLILARLGDADALVLEQPLHRAFDSVSETDGDARAAAGLALALARAGAAPQTAAGAQACVALALAVLSASRAEAPEGHAQPQEARALLEAAADMAAAVSDEIGPALEDGAAMAALLSAYADHL